MDIYRFGDTENSKVIIQAIDERSLPSVEDEVRIVYELTGTMPYIMAVAVDDWFSDLSPWEAPAVFDNRSFGSNAGQTLEYILGLSNDSSKEYYLGGYSLSGLFALWAGYQTDKFNGIAAASPSMWFPGFLSYMEEHQIRCDNVYLSLGDRESRTKNKAVATVGDCIQSANDILVSHGINCVFELNRGNHFTDVEIRCARAFARILENNYRL